MTTVVRSLLLATSVHPSSTAFPLLLASFEATTSNDIQKAEADIVGGELVFLWVSKVVLVPINDTDHM